MCVRVRQFPVSGQAVSGLYLVTSVCAASVLSMFVLCVHRCVSSMLAVVLRGVCFQPLWVSEQVVSALCSTCGLVASVCEQLCGFLFCIAFQGILSS